MSTSKARNKKRGSESLLRKSDPKTRLIDDFDPDPDLSNDLKGIMSTLQLIKLRKSTKGRKKEERRDNFQSCDFFAVSSPPPPPQFQR
ncbi:hypothetical protein CXB51_026251 [Gossypium anomalum]|uniref:Uncharacterized protein n=1 Tax=Gossypium anomalum TaxID=47600 RepID=A0A8J6CR12_9ROSI|nr:hypothetical protein CXB51_026251 [Gossypium anomalum]